MKISIKLVAGFGIVLVLAVVVGLAGLNAMQTTNERVGKEAATRELVQNTYEIRQAEKNYIARRDTAEIDEARELMSLTMDKAEQIGASFENPANKKTTDEVIQALRRYETAFNELVQATKLQLGLESDMREGAREIEALAEALRANQKNDLHDMLLRDDATAAMIRDELEEAEGVNRLIKRLLAARMEEKNYLIYGDVKYYDRAIELVEEAVGVMTQVKANLDSSADQSKSDRILGLLESYQASLGKYVEARDAQAEQVGRMTEAARETEAQAQDALALQAEERNAGISQASTTILVTLLAAVALGMLIAMLITRGITRPMRRINDEVARLAEGDLTVSFDTSGKDEIGDVGRGLEKMAQNLRQLVFEITSASTQLGGAAEEMSTISRKNTEGVQQQQSEIAQVAASMNEMSSTVQEVSRHAQETDQSTKDADQQSVHGDQQVRKVITAIHRLAEDVNRVDNVIRELNAESANIGNVLEVIQNVAEQTNLLALNAAIEAARAGEHGRGFAVVADEVRTLARRTHDSTEEIQTMIEKLQRGASQSAQAIEQSQAAVQETVTEAENAGIAIDQVKNAIRRITDMTAQIASAAEQQGAVAEEISTNLGAIDEVSQESARGGEQTTQASQELAKLADQLQTLIGRFKLK